MKRENYTNANGIIICNSCSKKLNILGQIETTNETETLYCECCGDTII